jgi:hypothetical protein
VPSIVAPAEEPEVTPEQVKLALRKLRESAAACADEAREAVKASDTRPFRQQQARKGTS